MSELACVCVCVCVCVRVRVCMLKACVFGSRGRVAYYLAARRCWRRATKDGGGEPSSLPLSLLCALHGQVPMPCSGFVELPRAWICSLCEFTRFTSTSIYPKDTEPNTETVQMHGTLLGRSNIYSLFSHAGSPASRVPFFLTNCARRTNTLA